MGALRGATPTEDQTRCQLSLPPRKGFDLAPHERVQDLWVIVELDVDVEHDVLCIGLHEQIQRLGKRAYPLCGQLGG